MCVRVRVCVRYICVLLRVDVRVMFSIHVCVHAPRDKFEVVSWMYETLYIAEFAAG